MGERLNHTQEVDGSSPFSSANSPAGSYDAEAAQRGQTLFNSSVDSFPTDRGPERRYVTTPLRALFDMKKIHKGGFYNDGRFRGALREPFQVESFG